MVKTASLGLVPSNLAVMVASLVYVIWLVHDYDLWDLLQFFSLKFSTSVRNLFFFDHFDLYFTYSVSIGSLLHEVFNLSFGALSY